MEKCTLKSKANLEPTRIYCREEGIKSATCTDLIFTNAAELCSKTISIPVYCSDHNLVAIGRKTKVPKAVQKIIIKRMFKNFNKANYYENVTHIDWTAVLSKEDPDQALQAFNDLLRPVIEKHAPVRKQTVRNVMAPWLDKELQELMEQRNKAKVEAIKSADVSQWNVHRKLRNKVTKFNKTKKRCTIKEE